MGKRYKNLFEKVYEIDNLRDAYAKAVRGGNRYSSAHLRFKEHLEANLYVLQMQLKNEQYTAGAYTHFRVYEPKERLISALPFRDRIVQHAINNVVEPIFEKVFYPCTYACRPNKGTHKGVKAVQSSLRRYKGTEVFYLKMDFAKYFYSIDRSILFKEIRKKISDEKLIALLMTFENDKGVGIPVGNLLSQLFANIYGHIFDRFIKTRLHVKHYFRYMDDTIIVSDSKQELVSFQKVLKRFASLFMKLRFSKWFINAISKPLNFLGYRITQTYKLIRKQSWIRAQRKIKHYIKYNLIQKLKEFLASWSGHLRSADSFNLIQKINQEMRRWQMQLA